MSNPWVQPDSRGLGWIKFDPCDELSWVRIFSTHARH